MKRPLRQPVRRHARGTILPLLVLSILAICALGALVLDRLWIDAAQVQLNAAAEAAALAAASRLASDERLRDPDDATASMDEALLAALRIAGSNYVAGQPVVLDPSPEGDVRFGRIVDDPTTGEEAFLETQCDPTTVRVFAQVLQQRENALQLFFRGVSGQLTANARGRAQATIENRIVGVRPLAGTAVPCLPLGILEADPSRTQQCTWEQQIELGQGADRYRYDEISQNVVAEPDGIPEIELTVDGESVHSNARIIDLGTNLSPPLVRRQIVAGIPAEDLQAFGGSLILEDDPILVTCSAALVGECDEELAQQIGKSRICLLYQQSLPDALLAPGETFATRLVAVRLLQVARFDDGSLQIVLQPTVVVTRTAVLSKNPDACRNPYIYKLYLTQ